MARIISIRDIEGPTSDHYDLGVDGIAYERESVMEVREIPVTMRRRPKRKRRVLNATTNSVEAEFNYCSEPLDIGEEAKNEKYE